MGRLVISRFFCFALLLTLFLTLSVVAYYAYWLHKPLTNNHSTLSTVIFEVKRGESLSSVASRLESELSLDHPRVFTTYARINKLAAIKHGEYALSFQLTPVQLLVLLNRGKVIQHFVTFIEGMTVNDVLLLLQSQSNLSQPSDAISVSAVANRLNLEGDNPEGWLFPDTYAYTKGQSVWMLIEQSHQKMKRVLEQEWAERASDLPYETPYEALIMASIVEKETGVPFERSQIAGVFVRRLQKRMRLQTDPTVIYGLGEEYNGNLTRSHLKQKTPYNTYTIAGLPPTPIAIPGREAIHAVLHPKEGESLYFVARGDGTHVFSSTLADHQKAVKRFQLKRTADYRSTIQ